MNWPICTHFLELVDKEDQKFMNLFYANKFLKIDKMHNSVKKAQIYWFQRFL